MPSLKMHPTMVVPVLVALGSGKPLSARKWLLSDAQYGSIRIAHRAHRIAFEKSKPDGLYTLSIGVDDQAGEGIRASTPPAGLVAPPSP